VRVSTPEDPASARFGETFWEFLPRSVIGSARSSVHLEAQRIRRLGKSPWNPTTYLSNDVLNAWAMSAVLFGALIAVFGVGVIPFIVIEAIFGFSLLEAVNYLEHYGLLRQKNANDRYERCAPVHSWNSDHIVTNLFLYHLQRHSDHHANPTVHRSESGVGVEDRVDGGADTSLVKPRVGDENVGVRQRRDVLEPRKFVEVRVSHEHRLERDPCLILVRFLETAAPRWV
jgi:hypothetical protein